MHLMYAPEVGHGAGCCVEQSCSSVLFLEARKKKDLYIWLAKVPEGPSVKFHVTNGEPLVQCAFLYALSTPLC